MNSLKKIVVFVLAVITANTIYAQKGGSTPGYTQLKGGLEYKMLRDAPGNRNPKTGDFIEFHLKFKLDDSLMTDTRKEQQGNPTQTPMQPATYNGDFWNAVALLTPGDSAIILQSVDSLVEYLKKQPGSQGTPPILVGKKKVKYEIVLVSVKSQEDMQKEQDAKNAVQLATDDKILQEYFAKNKIQAKKTASGLYYRIATEGTGEVIKKGQTAQMKYIGTTLDGKVFDANMGAEAKRTEALPVPVGTGQVIRGWDEGLLLLKKGSKAFFYIPSPLAYGSQAMGEMIPANSVLIFEVEVEDVK